MGKGKMQMMSGDGETSRRRGAEERCLSLYTCRTLFTRLENSLFDRRPTAQWRGNTSVKTWWYALFTLHPWNYNRRQPWKWRVASIIAQHGVQNLSDDISPPITDLYFSRFIRFRLKRRNIRWFISLLKQQIIWKKENDQKRIFHFQFFICKFCRFYLYIFVYVISFFE